MIKPRAEHPRNNCHQYKQHDPNPHNRSIYKVHLFLFFGSHFLLLALLFLRFEFELSDCGGGRAGEYGFDELFDFAACDADFEEIGVPGGGFFVDYFDVAEKDLTYPA